MIKKILKNLLKYIASKFNFYIEENMFYDEYYIIKIPFITIKLTKDNIDVIIMTLIILLCLAHSIWINYDKIIEFIYEII